MTPYQGDSHLVVKKVQKEYDCNNEKMSEYQADMRRMEMFLMDLKFGMSHVWKTAMLII
jgi:hypothetical protein